MGRAPSDLHGELHRIVARFAADVAALAINAAYAMAVQALANGDRGRDVRRRQAVRAETAADELVVFVTKHPGLSIERISELLGTNAKQLSRPIRKLVAHRVITATKKRSPRYYPNRRG